MVKVEPPCDSADLHGHSPERLSRQDTEASLQITTNKSRFAQPASVYSTEQISYRNISWDWTDGAAVKRFLPWQGAQSSVPNIPCGSQAPVTLALHASGALFWTQGALHSYTQTQGQTRFLKIFKILPR